MTVLDIITNIGGEIGIPVASNIISNDSTTKQLVALLNRTGKELRRAVAWTELEKTARIVLQNGVTEYPYPIDLDTQISEVYWNNTQNRPVFGPLTPQEEQSLNFGVSVCASNQYFRIAGIAKNLRIIPTPTANMDGDTIYFKYISKNWIRPSTQWQSGIAFSANTYCYYQDNIYYTATGGISGMAAPIHMEGIISDGMINWQYTILENCNSNTDVPILDEELLTLGVMAKWLKAKGLDAQDIQFQYEKQLKARIGQISNAGILSIFGRATNKFATYDNMPDKIII